MWAKVVSYAKKDAKAKEAEEALFEKVLSAAFLGSTAFASGYLFAKVPSIQYVGPVPVQPTLGVVALAVSFFLKPDIGNRVENVGYGLLLPWLADKGTEMAI